MDSELCRNRTFYPHLSLLNPIFKIIFVVIIVKKVVYFSGIIRFCNFVTVTQLLYQPMHIYKIYTLKH